MRWRMWIDCETHLLVLIADLPAPYRGVGEEEPLIRRQPVDLLLRFSSGRFLERRIRDFQSANVGNIFALRQLTIHMHPRKRLVFRVLLYDRTGAFLKLLCRIRRPPVAQIALGIVLTPLIVEAVGHFMSDH